MFLGSVRQIGQLDSESGLASGWTLVAETGAVCVCVCVCVWVGGCMCMCICVYVCGRYYLTQNHNIAKYMYYTVIEVI